jgi:hypothetical protein
MCWKDDREYDKDAVFSDRELRDITPNDIYRFFKHKAYGDPDCDERESNPTLARANTLKYYKKAISQCLPDPHMPWNDLAKIGNPTKSFRVNKLIQCIRRKEVAGLGARSRARRDLTVSEFECVMDIIESKLEDEEDMVFMSAYFKYQYNMISRLDDTAKLRRSNLKVLHQYPDFGIVTRLCWSKNVMEERDAPNQILFGSFDCRYCSLIGLGTWLEYNLTIHPEPNDLVFSIHGLSDPASIKSHAAYELDKIFKRNDFVRASDIGYVGTHSMRKFASTKARGSGCSKDDTDLRARWKSDKRQQDAYNSVTIPYIDAKVAAVLCKGGPCTYSIKRGSGITDDWILEYVVPQIRKHHDRQIAIVLGKALLWKIFSNASSCVPQMISCVPQMIRNRVLNHYKDVTHSPGFESSDNPIEKLPLAVDGADAELLLDILFLEGNNAEENHSAGDDTTRPNGTRSVERQEIHFLRSQILHLREENSDLKKELERRDRKILQQLNFINLNIRRIANAPGRPLRQQTTTQPMTQPMTADTQEENRNDPETVQEGTEIVPQLTPVLMKHPRTLHDLWREYEIGYPGHKPAKDFTAAERGGRNKHTFYLRKFLWNKVSEMIRSGLDANDACDRIYDAYGHNQSVSNILKKLQNDSKTGGHPNLRIVQI